jgi:serine/threonine protein kinase
VDGLRDELLATIRQELGDLLRRHAVDTRSLRLGDGVSLHAPPERQRLTSLFARVRELPELQRNDPVLLTGLGKLKVLAGNLDAAQSDFLQAIALATSPAAKAEAHYNAYTTALERRDWNLALRELLRAVKIDPKGYAPFPMGKYRPARILGAGGFGVAFLCKHKYLDAQVVVKAVQAEALDRDLDKVFTEAHLLRQLDHPAVVRLQDCGYTDAAGRTRPYFVMDYFDGLTLEQYVEQNGHLAPEELVQLACPVLQGLQAAHDQGILHRDVKPANLLIRRDGSGWQVKLIDFGLALRVDMVRSTLRSGGVTNRTVLGASIAGTLEYAAPEQMGKLPGVPMSPQSDLYGFGKVCCYALFQTPQPLLKHWRSIPPGLAEFLEQCLEENPRARPSGCAALISWLRTLPPHTPEATPALGPSSGTPPPPSQALPPRPVEKLKGAGRRPNPAVESNGSPSEVPEGIEPARSSRGTAPGSPSLTGECPPADGSLRRRMYRVRLLEDLRRLLECFTSVEKLRRLRVFNWVWIACGCVLVLPVLQICASLRLLPGPSILDHSEGWICGGFSILVPCLLVLGGKSFRLVATKAACQKQIQQMLADYPSAVWQWGGEQVLRSPSAVQELIRGLESESGGLGR